MSAKQSAQELFPNLFAKPAATPQRSARELAPADMRLLQWAMRQQARRTGPQLPRAPQPSRLAGPSPRSAAPARPAPRPAARQMPAR